MAIVAAMHFAASPLAVLLSLSAAAQHWLPMPSSAHPPKDAVVAMAHDAARDRIVCVASELISTPPGHRLTTWEWDGVRWLQRATSSTPPASIGMMFATAYDPLLRRVVLVVGTGSTSTIGTGTFTWTFDGVDWELQSVSWPPIFPTSLTFDPVRGVLVLAAIPQGTAQGIFEQVNGVWALRASLAPASHSSVLGFDPITGRIVAFGGTIVAGSSVVDVSTTWSWDGTALTVLSPATVPSGRNRHVMVNDPVTGQLLLAGGASAQPLTVLADVHAWTGTNWLAQPSLPSPRMQTAAATLGGSIWMFGGADDLTVWASHGGTWNELLQRNAAGTWAMVPLPSAGTCAAHDTLRARTVSVRNGRTVEFDGYRWIDVGIPLPTAAAVTAIAFHAQTARIVAFDDAGATWLYDGLAWTQAVTPVAPPPRSRAGMGYDPSRNVVALFGGVSGATMRNDVWEWNGTAWTHPVPASPPTSGPAAIAWDGLALHVIVTPSFGAWRTWTWDGTAFSLVVSQPLGNNQSSAPRLAYDPALGLVAIVRNGADYAFRLAAGAWQPLSPAVLDRVADDTLVLDTNRGQLVLHDASNQRDLISSAQPAAAIVYGASCSGSTLLPRLSAPVLPQLGAGSISDVDRATPASFAFVLADLAPANVPLPGGCTVLLQNPIVLAGAPTNGTGFASATFAIPPAPALRGVDLFEQALVLDPAGALLGFANLTNGLQLRIGD